MPILGGFGPLRPHYDDYVMRVERSRFTGLRRQGWQVLRPVLVTHRFLRVPLVAGFGTGALLCVLGYLAAGALVVVAGIVTWFVGSGVVAARTNRVLIAKGLQQIGIRYVPGFRRFEDRSPRVGHALSRAWEGHETRSLARLTSLALDESGSRGERSDACLALADWHLAHGRAELASPWLERAITHRRRREHQVLTLEAAALGAGRWPSLPRGTARRLGRDSDVGFFVVNNAQGPARLGHLNALLTRAGLTTVTFAQPPSLAGLTADPPRLIDDGPLVTVIVPMFNAEASIEHALRSLTSQTWRRLEILVVDDASNDESVARALSVDDSRIRVLVQPANQGTYVARNRGLAEATGDFITVHDADDWCHPERIERQVVHLIEHCELVGTTSTLVRATGDLVFTRRDLTHSQVLGVNTASLLVRTEVARSVGGWDSVRAGADSEFVDRLRMLYGARSVEQILTSAPLTIALRSSTTLTSSSTTGLASQLAATGARNLYRAAYSHWHATAVGGLDRTDEATPFFAPHLLRNRDASTHLDVVIVSDFSLPGGTTASNLTEIAANEALGLRTGLVHNRNPTPRPQPLNPKVLDVLSPRTTLLTDGEHVSCDVVIIKYPPSVMEIPDRFPRIQVSGDVVLAVNQTPFANYGRHPDFVYDIVTCDSEVRRVFETSPLWSPIGPAVRNALTTHHTKEIENLRFSDDDWIEIIDLADWSVAHRAHSIPRIGRHGRDSEWKWPSDPAVIRSVYPESTDLVIDILGGADTPTRLLRGLPSNWEVRPFDSVSVAEYLAQLDVFVYFPHPDMVEGFGRTILEAMAAGVPCVVDSRFGELFGDAVIACSPEGVQVEIQRVLDDHHRRRELVTRGKVLVESRFGFSAHEKRLARHRGRNLAT